MKCEICPRRCGVDRNFKRGFCGESWNPRIALVSLHQWEEPCLIGENGAGTIFFSGCSLRCCYCQNREISQRHGFGIEVSTDRLAEIFLEQQNRGASNLDLVTPTHFVPAIIDAIEIARRHGLNLPIVYNSHGYENLETLEMLRGSIDIFLPDLKSGAEEFSNAPNYFEVATRAIQKMFEIAGDLKFDPLGNLKRGMIIRHLILPNHRKESLKIVEWIAENFKDRVILSLMRQYTPMPDVPKSIDRKLTSFEYDSVVNRALDLGLEKIFVQELESSSKNFIPTFNGENVI